MQKRRLDFLRRYMDLYSEYAQAELQFIDDNVLALHNALEGDDQEKFACDTSVVDWQYYLQEVHCPSVTESMRRLDVVRKKRNKALAESAGVLKKVEPSEDAEIIAAFDMDGTLLSSNVIETYLWMRLPELDGHQRAGEIGAMLRKLPKLIAAERKDRGTFLRTIYRRYEGADLEELNQIVDEVLAEHVLERLSGAAVRRIREHSAAGHKTILITGAVRPLTRPLEPLFDEIVAAELAVDDRGRCTGFLSGPPLVGESRAAWIKHRARGNQHRPVQVVRLRRQPLGPADADGGRQPGRGLAGCVAVPGRPGRALADRRLEDPVHVVPSGDPRGDSALEVWHDDARSRDVPVAGEVPGGQGGRRPDPRHPDRSGRAAAARHHQRAEGRPGGLGADPADPVRHLRLRPRHGHRPHQAVLLRGGVDAVRPRSRDRRRAARRLRGPAEGHPRGDGLAS